MLSAIIISLLVIIGIGLFVCGLYWLRYFFGKRKLDKKIDKMLNAKKEYNIENVNDIGFDYVQNQERTKVKWKDIENVVIERYRIISIKLKNKAKYNINTHDAKNLLLLKRLPKKVKGHDSKLLSKYLQKLSDCEICGTKAIEEGECMNCVYSKEYETEYIGEDSRIEFLKKEQLDYFSVHFNLTQIEDIIKETKKNEIFLPSLTWKILITQSELDKENKSFKK